MSALFWIGVPSCTFPCAAMAMGLRVSPPSLGIRHGSVTMKCWIGGIFLPPNVIIIIMKCWIASMNGKKAFITMHITLIACEHSRGGSMT